VGERGAKALRTRPQGLQLPRRQPRLADSTFTPEAAQDDHLRAVRHPPTVANRSITYTKGDCSDGRAPQARL